MSQHKLIIAEKPSVAQSIASVIGAKERKEGYLQGNGYIVSWCIGHLVGLASPERYEEKYSKWRREDLPIFPTEWQYTVSGDKKKQFDILKKLMNDKMVDSIICATDAGREGELIFRLVYEQAKCTKPIQRLWISSMEDEAIRNGMKNLKNGEDFNNLYSSALCRAQADWLVGMNATRLFSILYGQTLNVGRVMTPTLTLITQREADIQNFESKPFYKISLDCGSFTASSESLNGLEKANQILAACNGQNATIRSIEKQQKKTTPPKLYDLTSLQRDANRLYGYTAQQTLDYLQSLYERKLTTYPRTDSRYLTSDMQDSTKQIAIALSGILPFMSGISHSPDISQVINNAKVSDHHAVIPTWESIKQNPNDLPQSEKDIWMLVANRLLCSTALPYDFETVSVILDCAGYIFTAKGKTTQRLGWKEIDEAFKSKLKEKPESEAEEPKLPEMQENQTFDSVTTTFQENKTVPPKRFTEDTLLSAMENAGKADIPENAEHKGLGTPATRAGTIEKLVKIGYIERKKKNLFPTEKGVNLITVLPDQIKSPTMTAEWEFMLKEVENGEKSPECFLDGIRELLGDLIQSAETSEQFKYLFPSNSNLEAIGVCPRCGETVSENSKGFFCENRECKFALWKNSKFFTSKKKNLDKKIAAVLLKEGRIFMSDLYSEKTDKTYDAEIILDDTGDQYVNFKMEFRKVAK